jgi:hypothetical protein
MRLVWPERYQKRALAKTGFGGDNAREPGREATLKYYPRDKLKQFVDREGRVKLVILAIIMIALVLLATRV